MNTAEAQRSSYGDPLALLKHCDATTLEKLCDTLTNTSDDTVAYINFPKRSLVRIDPQTQNFFYCSRSLSATS